MIFKENEKTELKRELNDSFEKEVCAFLNTLGRQILIVIEDDGEVCGIENADKIALIITDKIKNNILPSAKGLFTVEIKTRSIKILLA